MQRGKRFEYNKRSVGELDDDIIGLNPLQL